MNGRTLFHYKSKVMCVSPHTYSLLSRTYDDYVKDYTQVQPVCVCICTKLCLLLLQSCRTFQLCSSNVLDKQLTVLNTLEYVL